MFFMYLNIAVFSSLITSNAPNKLYRIQTKINFHSNEYIYTYKYDLLTPPPPPKKKKAQ